MGITVLFDFYFVSQVDILGGLSTLYFHLI